MKMNDLMKEVKGDEEISVRRKYLLVTSLILILIQFTSIKVEEVNTFILKFSIINMNGGVLVLWFVTLYLFVKYYSYSYGYLQKAQMIWSNSLATRPPFTVYKKDDGTWNGYISNLSDAYTSFGDYSDFVITKSIHTNLIFNSVCKIYVKHIDGQIVQEDSIFLLQRKYKQESLEVFKEVSRFWFHVQLRSPLFLDLYGPVIVGVIALTISVPKLV